MSTKHLTLHFTDKHRDSRRFGEVLSAFAKRYDIYVGLWLLKPSAEKSTFGRKYNAYVKYSINR